MHTLPVKKSPYEQAVSYLCSIHGQVMSVSDYIMENAAEIRLRAGRPVIIETADKRYTLGGAVVSAENISACVASFCDYSVHSCQRELSEGFVTLRGGHRAGFSGTAVYENGKIKTIKDISSINLRIAREHRGIAERLARLVTENDRFGGMLIIGEPMSAKTTMLRDLCRLAGGTRKVAVIDERGEIAAMYKGEPQHSVGTNTDVLDGFLKGGGIELALRALSPQIIMCDEIDGDFAGLCGCISNGVRLILTAHCGGIDELKRSPRLCGVIEAAGINYIALLDKGKNIGKVKGLWYIANDEDIFSCDSGNNLCGGRNIGSGGVRQAGCRAQTASAYG